MMIPTDIFLESGMMHRMFCLGEIKPNPFRNDRFPIDEGKVSALIGSYERTGYWDNIVARIVNGDAELAFGHHRLEALKRKYGEDYRVNLIIKKLDDETMLHMLADENMQEWASSAIVVQETVRAAILAYAEGKIRLVPEGEPPVPSNAKKSDIRYAPYFVPGRMVSEDNPPGIILPYTGGTLARFLGWQIKQGEHGLRPDKNLLAALKALEEAERIGLTDEERKEIMEGLSVREGADVLKGPKGESPGSPLEDTPPNGEPEAEDRKQKARERAKERARKKRQEKAKPKPGRGRGKKKGGESGNGGGCGGASDKPEVDDNGSTKGNGRNSEKDYPTYLNETQRKIGRTTVAIRIARLAAKNYDDEKHKAEFDIALDTLIEQAQGLRADFAQGCGDRSRIVEVPLSDGNVIFVDKDKAIDAGGLRQEVENLYGGLNDE
jgi:hypothetical protein